MIVDNQKSVLLDIDILNAESKRDVQYQRAVVGNRTAFI